MDNEATERLKFDRRLASRRGWVERGELAQELAALPDSADKIHVHSDEAPGAAPPAAPPSESVGSTAAGPGSEGGTPGA